MIAVLKPSELKSDAGGVLDKAIQTPQYVLRKGVLLVITTADMTDNLTDNWSEMLAADTWEKLGPAPEIDYDKI